MDTRDGRRIRITGRGRMAAACSAWGCIGLLVLGACGCSEDAPAGAANPAGAAGSLAGATAGTGGALANAGAAGVGNQTSRGSGGATAGRTGAAGAASSGVGGATVSASGSGGVADLQAGAGGSEPAGCTRERLKATVDAYFAALSAKDPAMLSLTSGAKFTENGETLELGEGLWETAGAVAFKHSAFDTQSCSSVTESVVASGSTDLPVGLRLKLEGDRISEIESIVVRSGDYFVASNTRAITATASEDWEALLEPGDRGTREALEKLVDDYFAYFPAGACGFAEDCKRLENGFSPGACTVGLSCSTSGEPRGGMTPRLHVIDVEAGIAVAFVMFAGSYTDFHMFKVRDGEVHGVHAILAEADGPGWE